MEKIELAVTVFVARGGEEKSVTATLDLFDVPGDSQPTFETLMELAHMAAKSFKAPIPVVPAPAVAVEVPAKGGKAR